MLLLHAMEPVILVGAELEARKKPWFPRAF